MIRPIEELLAYYAFTNEDAQARKRPSLSAQARAMAVEFEAIMKDPNYIRPLVSRFGAEATGEELRQLANLYLTNFVQAIVDMDSPTAELESIDVVFETYVENFVKMQERARLRKRFSELRDQELVSTNELRETEFFENRKPSQSIFEDMEPSKTKSEGSLLWRIIFLLVSLAVAAMVIRFVWLLIKS